MVLLNIDPFDPSETKYLTSIIEPTFGIKPKPPFPKIISIPPLNPVLSMQAFSSGSISYMCVLTVTNSPSTKTS